jgi:bifunctional DNA-binding transcriptional regulator/antitoxin component of YhaV-PrlF toxin-antitoxin module
VAQTCGTCHSTVMEGTNSHATLRIGAQGRVVLPAGLRRALGFVEGGTLVAHVEGEGRLVIESPEAIQRALLQEWAGVGGDTSLVEDLRAERRAAAAREAEQVETDRAAHASQPTARRSRRPKNPSAPTG